MGIEGNSAEAQHASLRDYTLALRRRKWLIVLCTVLVPIVAVLFSLRGESKFAASSEVLLSRQNLALTLTQNSDASSASPERLVETQAQIASVPEIARRVLARVHFKDRLPEDFLASASVAAKPNADILLFTVVDHVPSVAVALANAYAAEYTRYRRELDTIAVSRARHEVEGAIAQLEKRGERDSALYASLVGKRQELRTIESLQTSNSQVVREASRAIQIAPRPKRNAVLGVIFGFVLGIGIAFLREALDTRARSTEEIERALGLPLLARIAAPPRHLQRANKLVMLEEPRSTAAEAYRMLRTNFEFFNVEQNARTIMVTSAISEEGKSTTIANLAVALAAAGRRVVLVDLDLRRPVLKRYFDLDSSGLAVNDLLQGRALLQQARVDEEIAEGGTTPGAIEVLVGRPLRSEGFDLFAGDQVDRLLAELRERADYVLIDAPPLLLVGDAMQLSAKVDATLVVTRLNVVRKQMLGELRRALDAAPSASLGFVVTGAEGEPDYRYAYSYYYYGYGQRAKERRR